MTDAGPIMGKPLIESDRVEGTAVYDPAGNRIGTIKRLMIEKISGHVVYAVMSLGGFLGIGSEEHAVPWTKLAYDRTLGGYKTDITDEQLRGTSAFAHDREAEAKVQTREEELYRFFSARNYTDVAE
jgi:hypothetical protein